MHKTYQKYFIISSQRSGTNFLGSLLSSHSMIRYLGECFNPDYFYTFPHLSTLEPKLLAILRDIFPVQFIKHFIYRSYPSPIRAVGFKLLYTQSNKNRALRTRRFLRDIPDIKIIHLKRMNLLRSYISLVIMSKTNVIRATSKEQIKNVTITLDPRECLAYFKTIQTYQNYFDHFFSTNNKLNVTYENLVTHQLTQTDTILQFLNMPREKLTTTYIKLNRMPLPTTVTNYTSLKKYFRGTQWSLYFDE